MVFHTRCLSFLHVSHIFGPRSNTSAEVFHTANSRFDAGMNPPVVPNPKVNPKLRVFTLAELKTATNNFHDDNKIGAGGFAIVYKGTVKSLKHRPIHIEVAVKKIKPGQQGYKTWVTEVNVLGEINHDNLVKLIGLCNEDNQLLLVYEYMPKKSLDGYLSPNSNETLSWGMRLNIAKDAVTGLEHLHKAKIIFRDFKPSNTLLDNNWNAKLSDFGFARDGPLDGRTHVSTMVVGTKGYAAPEYVQTGRLTFKIDIWSYGIFLEELISGRPPTTRNNPENNSQCMRLLCCYAGAERSKPIVDSRLEGRYSEKSMQMVNLIAKKCLAKDPRERPTMSEVLEMVQEAIALENPQVG